MMEESYLEFDPPPPRPPVRPTKQQDVLEITINKEGVGASNRPKPYIFSSSGGDRVATDDRSYFCEKLGDAIIKDENESYCETKINVTILRSNRFIEYQQQLEELERAKRFLAAVATALSGRNKNIAVLINQFVAELDARRGDIAGMPYENYLWGKGGKNILTLKEGE